MSSTIAQISAALDEPELLKNWTVETVCEIDPTSHFGEKSAFFIAVEQGSLCWLRVACRKLGRERVREALGGERVREAPERERVREAPERERVREGVGRGRVKSSTPFHSIAFYDNLTVLSFFVAEGIIGVERERERESERERERETDGERECVRERERERVRLRGALLSENVNGVSPLCAACMYGSALLVRFFFALLCWPIEPVVSLSCDRLRESERERERGCG
jgi:hypothetical protein